MNAWFGLQLRRELVKLMSKPSGPKNRNHSVSSQRLSLDSFEGEDSMRREKDESESFYPQVDFTRYNKRDPY
jgi:hypothetical protein